VAKIYKKGVNNQLEINTTSGQLALRLLLQSESCDVVPSGLTAVPANYSADLAWESDGDPYQYEVSLSYNDESHTYTTYDKNITINNLPNGVTFSWSVRALCDPLQGGESVAGPDFTTVLCDAFTSEGFNGETFPPSDCWISSSTDNSPWKQVTTGTNPNCTPQEGSGMLQYFCYSYSPGKKGLLILPPVSVEANVNTVKEFSFYMYRDAGYSNNIDCVNIYISPVPDITGLSPYLTVYRSLIKSPVEAEEGWYQYKILLPPLDNGTAHIAIEGVSGYGNNIYVDNLTVTEIPHFADAGVTAITSLPAIGVNLTNAEPVTIQVKNRGSQSISDLPVKYEVNGVVVGDEIIAGPIASASEIEYTFDTPADLSEDGEYIIKAYTALTGDADANNDTITFALRNYSCAPIATFPWSESFDAWEGYSAVFPPTPCWTSTSNRQGNVDRPWIQVKTGVFPTCSPQGGEEDLGMLQYKCYNYSTGSKGTLRTPLIAGKGKVLEFSFWMYRENESPYGGPEYKDSVNIYAVSSDTALVKTVYRNKTLEPVETGEDGWYQYKVNLSPESDIYIDIEGVSNYGNNIYLDNIALDFLFGVVSTNIEEGETGVTVDQNVEITFNKAIEVSNPEGITIRKNSDNSLVSGIVSIVSDDGKSLSISHDALEYGATYTVTIPGGTISEAVEEGEEGLTLENDFTLSFTAEPLNITATIPASEATDVSVLQGIEVEFDKPISIVVNAHDKVTLTGGGQTFTFTNGVTVSDNKLLITHESTPFIHNTEYTISIEAGAVVGYNQDTTWTFTSIAAPVPTYTPEEDAENVALDAEVAVEFDRAPLHVSGTGVSDPITITDEEGNLVENVAGSYPATGEEEDENKKISITHDDFAYNTTYTVNIPVGKLIDAADYTTPITWSFTTKKAAIAVEDKTPTGENIAIDATVSITFDENVAINGTPDLSGISIAGGAAGISASYEDNVITIAHDLFEFETTYTVNVPVGSVIGCDEVITWSFKTVKDVAIQTPSVGKAIQVYPTVTKGMIKVYTLENATITITDISGRVLAIHKSEGDVKDIDLHYSNGIYFVTVESGKAVSTHKVVLEK
jgi:hypothetical protein